MIEYRPFWNCDSPALVEVWNRQPPLRRRLQPLTSPLLEQYALAKPYFAREGLLVARQGSQIVGFVHAGFAPGKAIGDLVWETGVIAQLIVDPACGPAEEVADELLRRAEAFLRDKGVRELVGGGLGWSAPFYLGLYGGSNLPGVLAGDVTFAETLRRGGYRPHREQLVLERSLSDFRPPVDRQFMLLRRQFRLQEVADDGWQRWDEACAWGWAERDRFTVVAAASGDVPATLTFWNVEPLSRSWGIRAAGLLELELAEAAPPELFPCFLGEALRRFQEQGISAVEVQVDVNSPYLGPLQRLGFQEVDRGMQFHKQP